VKATELAILPTSTPLVFNTIVRVMAMTDAHDMQYKSDDQAIRWCKNILESWNCTSGCTNVTDRQTELICH